MLYWPALWLHSTVYHLRWISLYMCPSEPRMETNLCGHSIFSKFFVNCAVCLIWFYECYTASLLNGAKLYVIHIILIIFYVCATLPFLELHFTEMVCFQCIICLHVFHIFFRLFVFMFDSRRFLKRDRHPIFSCFCAMIDVEQEAGQFSENMAGTENDINHVLSTFVDSEHEVPFLQLALRRYVWITFIIQKQWERILDTYVKYTKCQCKIW